MNTNFKIDNGEISDLKIITPFYLEDNRGFFLKNFERDIFYEMGINGLVSEEFESYSYKNVIRGMHFQIKNPQIKMVRAIQGSILDIAVDLRRDSATFGKHEKIILNDKNHYIFYIPAGFAHGFKVLSEDALVSYKCIGKYDRETDNGIKWNDKDLKIDWEIDPDKAIVSDRDASLMSLNNFLDKYKFL